MTGPLWQQADEIFDQAADLPPTEHDDFVHRACGDDQRLRAVVAALLRSDRRARSFLERPLGRIAIEAAPIEPPLAEGDHIGPYRVLRTIRHGGMGSVYLAARNDELYERQVAVKLIRRGGEGAEALARFHNERQILARLEHPYIARLYEGGTTGDGRPYLVMEYIDGLPIDRYCDRHRLSIDARLDLFSKVCEAVQVAHRHLLVHRDVKPENILVTGDGSPRLLDFGIAKALVDDGRREPSECREEERGQRREAGPLVELDTGTGQRLMTPRYASPEQVRGERLTTASDLYSLGVLLYELLTGRSPYPRRAGAALERAICELEALPPSQAVLTAPPGPGDEEGSPEQIAHRRDSRPRRLARRLRPELDAVVAKAIAKRPGERYASAEQLAGDVERFRRGLPVAALPGSLPYRAGKLLRRHRVAAASVAAGVLLLATVTLGFVRTTAAQAERVAHERDTARESLELLISLLEGVDPSTRGSPVDAREILATGLAMADDELADRPEQRAAVLDTVGRVYLNLALYDAARPPLEESYALRRELYGADHPDVAASLEHIARLASVTGDNERARRLYDRAIARHGRLHGENSLEAARVLLPLSMVHSSDGDSETAERLLRTALAVMRRDLPANDPELADCLTWLADEIALQGRFAEAESLSREALAVGLAARGSRHPDVAVLRRNLATIQLELGELAEAEELLLTAEGIQRAAYPNGHPSLASTLHYLGGVRQSAGRFSEAADYYRQALAIRRTYFGTGHGGFAGTLTSLASVLRRQGRYDEAEELLLEALELWRAAPDGKGHWNQTAGLHHLAWIAHLRGDLDGAETRYREALATWDRLGGPDHPNLAFALVGLARVLIEREELAEAGELLSEARALRIQGLPAGHWLIAETDGVLALWHARTGRVELGIEMLESIVAQLREEFGSEDYRTREAVARLAEVRSPRPGSGEIRAGDAGRRPLGKT